MAKKKNTDPKTYDLHEQAVELRHMGYDVYFKENHKYIDAITNDGWKQSDRREIEEVCLIVYDKRLGKNVAIFYLESKRIYLPSEIEFINVNKNYKERYFVDPRFYIIIGKMIEILGW